MDSVKTYLVNFSNGKIIAGLLLLAASLLLTFPSSSNSIPVCDSEKSIAMAIRSLNQKRALQLKGDEVVKLSALSTRNSTDKSGTHCDAIMISSSGKKRPVNYFMSSSPWAGYDKNPLIVTKLD
jgi:hypothetical protein